MGTLESQDTQGLPSHSLGESSSFADQLDSLAKGLDVLAGRKLSAAGQRQASQDGVAVSAFDDESDALDWLLEVDH